MEKRTGHVLEGWTPPAGFASKRDRGTARRGVTSGLLFLARAREENRGGQLSRARERSAGATFRAMASRLRARIYARAREPDGNLPKIATNFTKLLEDRFLCFAKKRGMATLFEELLEMLRHQTGPYLTPNGSMAEQVAVQVPSTINCTRII
jgi:hypothetical protein